MGFASLVPSLSAPQISIAYIFHTVSGKSLRHGKAGYEARILQCMRYRSSRKNMSPAAASFHNEEVPPVISFIV